MVEHFFSGKIKDLDPTHTLTMSLVIAEEGSGYEIQP